MVTKMKLLSTFEELKHQLTGDEVEFYKDQKVWLLELLDRLSDLEDRIELLERKDDLKND